MTSSLLISSPKRSRCGTSKPASSAVLNHPYTQLHIARLSHQSLSFRFLGGAGGWCPRAFRAFATALATSQCDRTNQRWLRRHSREGFPSPTTSSPALSLRGSVGLG